SCVRHAASNNLAAVASAVVVTFLSLKDGRKSSELRAPFMLLGMVGLFLGGLILANAIGPLIIYRYLVPAARRRYIRRGNSRQCLWLLGMYAGKRHCVVCTSLRSILNSGHRE